MSASESAPHALNLHNSIEQLIAETVRHSQTSHQEEKRQLTTALTGALTEIETSQQALNRAVDLLRAALGEEAPVAEIAEPAEVPTQIEVESEPIEDNPEPKPGPTSTPADDRGPHELDVIAHDANIANASGLQTWLRGRAEVSNAQTREFVNGELRLHLDLTTGLEMAAVESWLSDHGGTIVTTTDKVVEIRFSNGA